MEEKKVNYQILLLDFYCRLQTLDKPDSPEWQEIEEVKKKILSITDEAQLFMMYQTTLECCNKEVNGSKDVPFKVKYADNTIKTCKNLSDLGIK
jgi:hypothetical protein